MPRELSVSPSRRLAAVGWTALLLVAACGPDGPEGEPAAAPGGPARAEVLAELEAYYADFSARDWDAYSDHFWPGATITTVWRPPGEDADRVVVTSVPEFVERAPEGPGSRVQLREGTAPFGSPGGSPSRREDGRGFRGRVREAAEP